MQSVHQLQHPDRDIRYNSLQTSFLKEFEALLTTLQLSHFQKIQTCKVELEQRFEHSTDASLILSQ